MCPLGATMAPSEAVTKALEKAAKRAAQLVEDDTLGVAPETNALLDQKLEEAKDKSRRFSMDDHVGGLIASKEYTLCTSSIQRQSNFKL